MLWKKYGQPILLEEVKHFMLVILGLVQGKTGFFFFFFKPKTTSSSCVMRCACCEGLGWPGCHRALVDNSKMAGIEEESFAFRGDSGDVTASVLRREPTLFSPPAPPSPPHEAGEAGQAPAALLPETPSVLAPLAAPSLERQGTAVGPRVVGIQPGSVTNWRLFCGYRSKGSCHQAD